MFNESKIWIFPNTWFRGKSCIWILLLKEADDLSKSPITFWGWISQSMITNSQFTKILCLRCYKTSQNSGILHYNTTNVIMVNWQHILQNTCTSICLNVQLPKNAGKKMTNTLSSQKNGTTEMIIFLQVFSIFQHHKLTEHCLISMVQNHGINNKSWHVFYILVLEIMQWLLLNRLSSCQLYSYCCKFNARWVMIIHQHAVSPTHFYVRYHSLCLRMT